STGTDGGDAKYSTREAATGKPTLVVSYTYPTTGSCTATLQPDGADTYIEKEAAAANTNHGATTTMLTDPGKNNTDNNTIYSLVRFDLSTIPTTATVSSASLGVYVTTADPNAATQHNDDVHAMTTTWTEGTGAAGSGATWNDSDGSGAGDWMSSG